MWIHTVLSGEFEQRDELLELLAIEVAEEFAGDLSDLGIDVAEEFKALSGDLGPDDTAVPFIALLADQLLRFHAGEKARDVGNGGDHTFADGGAGESRGLGSAKNAEDVVLRGSDPPVARSALECALQAI